MHRNAKQALLADRARPALHALKTEKSYNFRVFVTASHRLVTLAQ
jgi:hypothetical protein